MLPPQTQAPPVDAAVTDLVAKDFRVLVVDDEPESLALVCAVLEPVGYQLEALDVPEQAAERLAAGDLDVLITDLQMPGLSGLEVCERARAVAPETVRILLTGTGQYQLAVEAIQAGTIYRFMAKPFDEIELRLEVQRACEHLVLRREVARLRREMADRDEELARLEDGS